MDLVSRLSGTIHNVKNKLQLIFPWVDDLSGSKEESVVVAADEIRWRLSEVNQQLVALLGLYQLENDAHVLLSQEVYLCDLILSCEEYVPPGIEVKHECGSGFIGFFDENLVKSVISDAVHNAVRFAEKRILLSARPQGQGVLLSVEDDGPGFDSAASGKNTDTGLGIHFAEKVAKAHQNNGEVGSVTLEVSEKLGGAAFRLYLP
jgi:signal transduction histidine kinase